MREEIEAAALFITKLVNKNISAAVAAASSSSSGQSGSSASSIHSSASSTSSNSSESPPGFDVDQTTTSSLSIGSDLQDTNNQTTTTNNNKVEQFRQCLTNALYERFHNHWFPDQPTKGQAYRCIRLNEWDRHDTTLQKACLQCGIDYKDLQLPVELTLWVDPEEVTCRFGETKGSHCLVAKFKDGELKDNNFNIDFNSIDIEIFQQATDNNHHHHHHSRQPSLLGSPDYHKLHNQHNHNSNYHFLHHHNNSSNNNHHHHQHHQQTQPPIHHRSNMNGKSAMFPSYHQNYLNGVDNNGNPIYYYF